MKTSSDPRHQARKIALSVVYSVLNMGESDFTGADNEIITTTTDALEIEGYDEKTLNFILDGLTKQYLPLTALIKKHSEEWETESMYKIDLAILLIATLELSNKSAPVKVIIDEAVELAKEFGHTESSKFINGVLAGVTKEIYGDTGPTKN